MGNRRPDSGHCRVPSNTSTCGDEGNRAERRHDWPGNRVTGRFSPPAARGASSSETSRHAHTLQSALWVPRPGATAGKGLNHLRACRPLPGSLATLRGWVRPTPSTSPSPHSGRARVWGRVLTVSAASRSAAHSTLGIIRATNSGLNSTGLMRTSVACGAEGVC